MIRNDFSKMGLEYLNEYSQNWDKDRKIKDLNVIKEMNNEKPILIEKKMYYSIKIDHLKIR